MARRPLAMERLENRELLAVLTFSGDAIGFPSEMLAASAEIDDAEGIRGAEIHIRYDSHALVATPASVQPGSVWSGNAMVVANVDAEAGMVVAYLFSTRELPSVQGTLFEVEFEVRDNVPVDGRLVMELAEARLNERTIQLRSAGAADSNAPFDHVISQIRPPADVGASTGHAAASFESETNLGGHVPAIPAIPAVDTSNAGIQLNTTNSVGEPLQRGPATSGGATEQPPRMELPADRKIRTSDVPGTGPVRPFQHLTSSPDSGNGTLSMTDHSDLRIKIAPRPAFDPRHVGPVPAGGGTRERQTNHLTREELPLDDRSKGSTDEVAELCHPLGVPSRVASFDFLMRQTQKWSPGA